MNGADAQPKRRPLSLRLKLTLWIVLIAGIIQLTLVMLAVFYFRLTLAGILDRRLEATAVEVAGPLHAGRSRDTDEDLAVLADSGRRYAGVERLAVALYDLDGAPVASSLRPAPALAEPGQPSPFARLGETTALFFRRAIPGFQPQDPRQPARVMLQRITTAHGRRLVLMVAATDRTYQTMMALTARVIAVALPAGILAAAVAGWIIGGIASGPIERLKRITLSLSPQTLSRQQEPLGAFREAAELERALEETRAKLAYAFQAQDRFIANVSHELKTPVAVVLAEAQTLTREDLPPASRRFAESTIEEMQRLADMIERFLALTRLRAGTGLADAKPADMNAVVMEAVVDSGKMARQLGVEIVPELAESDRPVEVLGDAEQLQLMLVNLLHNAIRFSPPGRPVSVRVADGGSTCCVTVRDHGHGIDPELLDSLFDRFASDPGDGKRGHGVGLAIAQGVAELHGGNIKALNRADGGCEFQVTLPLAPVSEGNTPP